MTATESLTRHPLSAAYDDIAGPAWDEFVNFLRRWGPGGRKATIYDGQVVDGWQLHRGCEEVGIDTPTETFAERLDREGLPADFTVEDFVNREQNHRRHETQDIQRARRVERMQRAVDARQRGESLRAIAAAEGVCPRTIQEDLAEAEASGVYQHAPEPSTNGNGHSAEHVTGTDGKKYKKKQPKKPKAESSPDTAQGKPSVKRKPLKDDFGNLLPERCRDAFADPFLQDAFDTLCGLASTLRKKFLADGMKKRARAYPHIETDGFIHGIGMIDNTLELLIQQIKTRRPAGVCQECEDGKGCAACCMSGMVHRDLYNQQKAKQAKG